MEFDSLNEENKMNPNQFYRNRTLQVLEKWGIQGEMNEYNVRNAASSYARIQIKYRIMKWVTIGAIAFLAIFMGLMIGSVVLGIEATKDFQVKDQVIVHGSQNSALKTSEVTYSTTLKLTTPLSVVQGIKSLRFDTTTKNGKKEYIEFEVVSFYYSNGRNLTLYGHTQMAKVLQDGSVEIIPITTVNGAKRFDSSRALRTNTTTATTTTTPPTFTTAFQPISTCEQFRNMNPSGRYYFANDINCGSTFYAPLPAFSGRINGKMFTLTMNINSGLQEAGIFTRLSGGAFLMNINFRGNITGTRVCGGIAARSSSGVNLFNLNIYSRIVCAPNVTSGGVKTYAGGLVGYLDNYVFPQRISFYRVLTQAKIKVNTIFPSSSYVGGMFALASTSTYKVFYKTITAAAYFEDLVTYFNVNAKRSNDEEAVVPNAHEIHNDFFGLLATSISETPDSPDTPSRVISVESDLNSVCDLYNENHTQEGVDWWEEWVLAFDDITNSYISGNENASSVIHEANVAMCINYYYNYVSQYEPVCCAFFGITYNDMITCYNYYCPNTLANKLSYPCYWCKDISDWTKKDTPSAPEMVNGTLIYTLETVPELYYPPLN